MRGRATNRRLVRTVTMRTGPQGEGQGVGGGGGQQQNNQQGGQNTGTGQGGQGAGGGGDGGDPFAGLFDDLPPDGGGQQGGNGGGQQQGGGQLDVDALMQRFESRIDSRINGLMRTLQGRAQARNQQQNQNGGQGTGGQQGGGQSDGFQEQAPVVDSGAVRESRIAFREYLGDQFKPISDVERQFAVNVGTAVLARRDMTGQDPDAVGREVAQQTAQAMLANRKSIRDATIAALTKQGAFTQEFLQKTGSAQQQSLGATGAQAFGAGSAPATRFAPPADGAAQYQAGAGDAAKYNQAKGWTKAPANQAS